MYAIEAPSPDAAVDAVCKPQREQQRIAATPAAQLACALLVAEERDPSSLAFACLDTHLAAAAEVEGLRVLYLPEEDELE